MPETGPGSEAEFPTTERTRVRRLPQRGTHQRAAVREILDAALVCHLGFVAEGQPFVIPTLHARIGDTVIVHGSAKSRTLDALAAGGDVCLTATLLDGLVLARSAFHHSVNYRSVMVFGRARLVEGEAEKRAALRAFTERIHPGRWDRVREPTTAELKGTHVLALPLEEAVAKVRTGPPLDDEEDLGWPVWAGVVPLTTVPGEPIADAHLLPGMRYEPPLSSARTPR